MLLFINSQGRLENWDNLLVLEILSLLICEYYEFYKKILIQIFYLVWIVELYVTIPMSLSVWLFAEKLPPDLWNQNDCIIRTLRFCSQEQNVTTQRCWRIQNSHVKDLQAVDKKGSAEFCGCLSVADSAATLHSLKTMKLVCFQKSCELSTLFIHPSGTTSLSQVWKQQKTHDIFSILQCVAI